MNARKVERGVRFAVMVGVVLCAGLIVRWYDLERLGPVAAAHIGYRWPEGTQMLWTTRGLDAESLVHEQLVEAQVTVGRVGPNPVVTGLTLTEVAALPGEELRVEILPSGAVQLALPASERPPLRFPVEALDAQRADRRLRSGVVPAGYVVLLAVPEALRPTTDSRQLGFVPIAQLRRRLVTGITFF